MPVTFESVRFGTVEVADDAVLDFPLGLIGLGGSRYAIIETNPGSGFFWLHSVDDPALALPIVSPYRFFADFELDIHQEDRERTGLDDVSKATLYVTVRATPDPMEATANLRAPLVVLDGKGYQVLNGHAAAELQAPLFVLAGDEPRGAQQAEAVHSADAA